MSPIVYANVNLGVYANVSLGVYATVYATVHASVYASMYADVTKKKKVIPTKTGCLLLSFDFSRHRSFTPILRKVGGPPCSLILDYYVIN